MKIAISIAAGAAVFGCLTLANTSSAQGTAFTYQGQLFSGTNPASGTYNLAFALYSVNTGGSPIATPVTNNGVGVTNGLFIVAVDFGSGPWNGQTNWLQIGVETNGAGSFSPLSPRQQVTPTPYAIFAANVGAAGLSGAYSGAVTFSNPSNVFDGNGGGLTNLNPANLTGTLSDGQLSTNVALLDANQTFTGTNIFRTGSNSGAVLMQGNSGIDTNYFTGLGFQYNLGSGESAIMASENDGHAFLTFYTKPDTGIAILEQAKIDRYGDVMIDQQNANSGVLNSGNTNGAGLVFGTGSATSGIASQRTAGVNQNGLDFYTGSTRQMSILSNGNVGINTTNPSTALQVSGTATATAFVGDGSGLTNLDASDLDSGVVSNSLLSSFQSPYITVSGGSGNSATATNATIGGGSGNLANGEYATIAGGSGNIAGGLSSTVGGGSDNFAFGTAATVDGGSGNQALGIEATVGGGFGNQASSNNATASGGLYNIASGQYATVGGGLSNNASGEYATIGGGYINTNTGLGATISGGYTNVASAMYSTVGGGTQDSATGPWATVGGGSGNYAIGLGSIVGGGIGNQATNTNSTVGGGIANLASGYGATVAGGGADGPNPPLANIASGGGSTVGGGTGNRASGAANGADTTVAGGKGNTASGNASSIGGGDNNQATDLYATVGGGDANIASVSWATIGGGQNNTNGGIGGTIGGGQNNIVTNGNQGTIGGGNGNLVSNNYATISGGSNNVASGVYATVAGGTLNTASGGASFVGGGQENLASGSISFAAGQLAQATSNNSFVWSDGTAATASSSTDSVTFRGSGGYFFYTGNGSGGAQLAPNATSWTALSDRNAKKNFQPVNTVAVLDKLAAIPIQQWNYKWEKDGDAPNIGPMAQDFKRAFFPGRDDKGISTLEFDGVELAAIQGLNRKLEAQMKDKDAEIQSLKAKAAQVDSLEKRLDELAEKVQALSATK